MHDLQEFLFKNLNLLILLAFVFAPIILKAMAKSREQASRNQPRDLKLPGSAGPTEDPGKPSPAGKGAALESKIRNFFEELSGEARGTRTPEPKQGPTAEEGTLPKPPPDPRFPASSKPVSMAMEESTGLGIDTPTSPFIAQSNRSRGRKSQNRSIGKPVEHTSLMDDITSRRPRAEDPYAVDQVSHETAPSLSSKGPVQVDIPWDHGKEKCRHSRIDRKELSGSNLRKAIILREILDPPVGLR